MAAAVADDRLPQALQLVRAKRSMVTLSASSAAPFRQSLGAVTIEVLLNCNLLRAPRLPTNALRERLAKPSGCNASVSQPLAQIDRSP